MKQTVKFVPALTSPFHAALHTVSGESNHRPLRSRSGQTLIQPLEDSRIAHPGVSSFFKRQSVLIYSNVTHLCSLHQSWPLLRFSSSVNYFVVVTFCLKGNFVKLRSPKNIPLNCYQHTWAIYFPMVFRSSEYLSASSIALRAKPTALAAT